MRYVTIKTHSPQQDLPNPDWKNNALDTSRICLGFLLTTQIVGEYEDMILDENFLEF